MSAATDFLTRWIKLGLEHAPSVTVVSCQPAGDMRPGRDHWSPGIACYGFGINGKVIKDGTGAPIGLRFTNVLQAFSDRVANPGASPPDYQRFDTENKDEMALDLTVEGDVVQLTANLVTWGTTVTATTTQTDAGGGQLMFTNVPPAGEVAVRAVMLVSFQPTGQFGWL